MPEGRVQSREQREPRVRHAKVKTGCITCRQRRVKCDENRPSCHRCLKYGTVCSGYPAGRRRAPSSAYGSFATQARPLVPKDESQITTTRILMQPETALFETDQEHRYFKLFVDRIAGEICPYFDSEDWSRMILQACTGESSIRHVAGAIGALGKWYETQHAGQSIAGQAKLEFDHSPSPGSSSGSEGQRGERDLLSEQLIQESYIHQRQAFVLYDKALTKMRSDIADGNQSKRTTLIIVVIITCLEAISGRHEAAAKQVYGGLKLIQEWKAEQKEAEKHPQGFSSPAPDVVDDFLVQTFGRMEIHAMSVFDPRPVEVHKLLKLEGKEVVQRMPTVFNSIAQARIYLDLINRRLMHFNMSINDRRTRPPASEPDPPTLNPVAWNATDGSLPKPIPWIDGKKFDHASPDSSVLDEQTSLNNELALWTATFKPLLTFSLAMGRQEAISALTLTISTIASHISLRAAFFTNELSFDVFIPEFRLIVEHATLLLETQRAHDLARHAASTPSATSPSDFCSRLHSPTTSTGPMMRFAFDIGIIPPLYLVMIKCRNRRLRRQALHLLKEYPRREGVWDTVAVTHLGRWVIGLEEESARQMSMSLSPKTSTGESESPAASSYSNSASGSETLRRGSEGVSNGASIGVRRASARQDSVASSVYDHTNGYNPASTFSNVHLNGHTNGYVNGNSSNNGRSPGHKDTDDEVENYSNLGIEIPEEIRVRKTWMRFDLSKRTAWMNCLQMDHVSGEFLDRSETVRW
ncbi:hypothetical protein VTL71DRAFT_5070 [Oculimacula yallundae]|uniref:Zn(2)-C6 fungal-type domain-containing protein n=1 Tax=Oculimacula yallundae TaxID=86028 RepID=A0ABR4C034_9HELO